ncbi:hypothetical protein BU16DRAFT_616423 [Lophium mytilinum]|uniref:Uncharacterized protein n=1 Tax=Lophium mytilinum TaxID=390894 RepID=A0A6A6QZG9_9PEZI|nr:hypothetical protein BU16DRAFT_616423 [Lophium mytilinum]
MGNTLSNRPEVQVAGHYRPVLTNCPCSPPSNPRLRSRSRSPSPRDYRSPRYPPAYPLRGGGGPIHYRPPPGAAYRSPPPTPVAYRSSPRGAYPMASPHAPAMAPRYPPTNPYTPQPYIPPQPHPQRQPPYQPPYQAPYQPPYQPQYQPPRPAAAQPQPQPQPQLPPAQRDYAHFPGDPFLDACFCKTACRCRKGTRVLYRSRRADGTMGEGEIRYELKEEVERGVGCGGNEHGDGDEGRRRKGRGEEGACRERVKKSERKVLGRMDAMERGRRKDVEELRRLVGRGMGGGGGMREGFERMGGRGMREQTFGMGGGGGDRFTGEPYGEMGGGGGIYPGMAEYGDLRYPPGEESIPEHEFGGQAQPFPMRGMPPRHGRPLRGGPRQSGWNPGRGMDDEGGLETVDPRGDFGNRGRGGPRGGRPLRGRRGMSGRGMRPGPPLDDSEGPAGNAGGEGEEAWEDEDFRREHYDVRERPMARPAEPQHQEQQHRPPPQARRSSRMGSGQSGAQRGARGARMDSVQDEEYGGGPDRTV